MISGNQSVPMNPAPYFTAGISVICTIFGYGEEGLQTLLIRRRFEPCIGHWALPGVMLHPDEEVPQVRNFIIREVTGLVDSYTREIRAFTDKTRHPLGRVINVGYYSTVRMSDVKAEPGAFSLETKWFPINEIPDLVFDHGTVLNSARRRLRKRMRRHPTAFFMLPEKFTMPAVHNLFEQVFEKEIDKRNFSRKALQSDLILDSGEKKATQDNVGRLPRLYSFDWTAYKSGRSSKIRFDY
jgi:ADP-ribose pyrophosphatase YjhB (NUDIX family)